MKLIVDAHVHLFDGEGEPGITADALIAHMDGPYFIGGEDRRTDRALIMPSATRLAFQQHLSFREQHQQVLEACRKYPDRLIGNFMYNPFRDVHDGVATLRQLVTEDGFRCLKLHPTIHGYAPARTQDQVWPVLDAAKELGIPVLIHTGDPPFGYPLAMEPLADAFPELRIILAHFGVQRLVLAEEAIEVARKHDNVWLETSCAWENQLKQGIRILGSSKLIHGSDAPFHDMWGQLRRIEALGQPEPFGMRLGETDRERIFGQNAAEVFGL